MREDFRLVSISPECQLSGSTVLAEGPFLDYPATHAYPDFGPCKGDEWSFDAWMEGLMFRAVLLHADRDRDRVLDLPSRRSVPPQRVRLPIDFDGVGAFEVYQLVDECQWPTEAVYEFEETVPLTTEDTGRPNLPD
ncbi:hypothetical protein [Leifsonia sp. RAF41]|uniref:hypothetical protein n=1 Tax=Leifsonia sp. RAF41 TaxID=3233056 RepID=UPI003F9531BD